MRTSSVLNHRLAARFVQTAILLGLFLPVLTGCHDGPMYALKTVNPYYTMRAWKKDSELGVTDHERLKQIRSLSNQVADMPESDQQFWAGHLERIIDSDPSAEMRFHAVQAAGNLKSAEQSLRLIGKGLADESVKVQTACCRSLGARNEPEAVQLLAQTLGTTTELDVKHSAIAALKNHQGDMPVDALRVILEDQDPATVYLAMNSLRDVMGQDHGNDPQAWIAAIDSTRGPITPGTDSGDIRFAERESRDLQ